MAANKKSVEDLLGIIAAAVPQVQAAVTIVQVATDIINRMRQSGQAQTDEQMDEELRQALVYRESSESEWQSYLNS